MKKIIGVVSLLLGCGAGASYAQADESFREQQNYRLDGVSRLSFDVDHTDIIFVKRGDKQLNLNLTQRLVRGDEERCIAKLEGTRAGEALSISVQWPLEMRHGHCQVKRKLEVALDEMTLKHLDVSFRHGDLEMGTVGVPDTFINGAHGDIRLDSLNSDNLELIAKHGNVKIAQINSQELKLRGSHGDLSIGDLEAKRVEGRWSHGNTKFKEVSASKMGLKQAHGAMRIDGYIGDEISLENAHGLIRAANSQAETVDLVNRHGATYFEGRVNEIMANSAHGHVELVQQNQNFVRIHGRVDHADVRVAVPKHSVCSYKLSHSGNVNEAILKDRSACANGVAAEIQLNGSHTEHSIQVI